VNAVPNLISAARNTLAGLQFKLSFKSRRHGVALLPMVLALVITFAGNVLLTTAQSETPPKPAPTPAATPAKKPGPGENISPLASGQIKGRLVSTDGQLLTNANVMAQSLSGTPAAKPTRPDAEGRFVFDDLAPGSYILIGTAPG
jgi:predicted pyridoxine 5'-phosphate oxidase superfamily flavin-nucleotide-binding protein